MLNSILKRTRLVLLPLIIATAACSSGEKHADTPVAQVNDGSVIYLKPGDREPAQAPTVVWTPALVNADVTTANLSSQLRANVNQELTWFDVENYMEKGVENREVLADTTCYDMTCAPGKGKSELWNAYFNSTKLTRIDTLAAAIKGIGKTSAEALVAAKYFNSKPKSWSDFSDEINRAADAGVIKKSVATQVLQTYRSDNIVALGYGAGACKESSRPCQQWMMKAFDVQIPRQRKVERKKISDTRQFAIDLEIQNARLMSTEHDAIQFHINENGMVTEQTVDGTLNRYKVASTLMGPRSTRVVLTSDQRYMRNLPSNVVRQDQFLKVGVTPTFVIDVDPNLIPNQEDPNSQLVIDYTIKVCNVGWFFGSCQWGSTKALKVASAVISQARSQMPIELPSGVKAWIDYTVSRRNSLYFNPEPVSRTSDTLKN